MANVYVKRTKVLRKSLSELDVDLKAKFDFDYDSDFTEISYDNPYVDGADIEIDVLIETLNKMKSKGATHVVIENDFDHFGYDIDSYNIKLASVVEISEFHKKEEENKKCVKQEQIEKLKKEIVKLQRD